jgi:hypothetical protein
VARYEGVSEETVFEEERNDRNVSGGMATWTPLRRPI